MSDGTLVKDHRCVHLPPKELQVLRVLLASAGRLVDQDALLDRVWPHGEAASESLTRCIYSLRKILGNDRRYIVTVYGKGYRFDEPVGERRAAQRSLNQGDPQAPLTRGQALLKRYTPDSVVHAQVLLEQSVQHCPESAAAWYALAVSLIAQRALGLRTGLAVVKRIEGCVGNALALDPNAGDCVALMALLVSAQGSYAGAQALFRSAQRLGGESADALVYRAWHCWCWGEHDLAAALLDRLLSDEPAHAGAWLLRIRLVFCLRPSSVLTVIARARACSGAGHPLLIGMAALAMAFQGRASAARRLLAEHHLDTALPGEPGLWRCYVIARIDGVQGRRELDQWQRLAGCPPLCPAQLAVLRVLDGDAAVYGHWSALRARDCVWSRPLLEDPRLSHLSAVRASG